MIKLTNVGLSTFRFPHGAKLNRGQSITVDQSTISSKRVAHQIRKGRLQVSPIDEAPGPKPAPVPAPKSAPAPVPAPKPAPAPAPKPAPEPAPPPVPSEEASEKPTIKRRGRKPKKDTFSER